MDTYSKYHMFIPIIFAILIFILLQTQIASYWPDPSTHKEKYTGIPGVDYLLKIFVPFFTDALNDPTGLLLSQLGAPLGLVLFFNVALEASDPGVSGWITHYSLLVIAIQLLGGGNLLKCLTDYRLRIPAWIASENKKAEREDVPLNPDRVKGIFTGLFTLVIISIVAMSFFTNPTLQKWSIIFFQVSPLLAALFWVRKPKAFIDNSENPSVSDDGYKQVAIYYLIIFGLSIYSWVFFWVHAVDNNFLYLRTPFEQFFNGELIGATGFFIIDFAAIIASFSYWVFLLEEAKFTPRFWKFTWQNLILSPTGALALYGYDRYLEKTRKAIARSGSRYDSEQNERVPLF
ncbi:361_t:CDS:2, partial [Acaulospora morrowiae]